MAKLYKAEVYILDMNDDYESFKDFESCLSRNMRYGTCEFFNVEEKEFEWNDDVDLNYKNRTIETFKKYFD